MNNTLRFTVLSFVLMCAFSSCQIKQSATDSDKQGMSGKTNATLQEEKGVKAFVEKLLFAAGNRNVGDMRKMISENCVVGYTFLQDNVWVNRELSIEQVYQNYQSDQALPFSEIVSDYDIIVSAGRIAVVRADAILYRFGIVGKREVNNMILMKENEQWKLFSIAWTIHDQPPGKKTFDINRFAHGYAQAWGSQKAKFVSMYFAEDGVLQVNDCDPARGREAIATVAQGFMDKFPDMAVHFDSLKHKENGTEFHWTLTGSDTSPDGQGNNIKISGYELWTMSKEGLILDSKGSFDSHEYERQLKHGIESQ